jgi:geranylgeranyl diphosphate synthase type I
VYASPVVDIRTEFTDLLGDIENEMRSILAEHDEHARPLYEMLAYHLGLDQPDGPRGKRIRPLLGLLAYRSLGGDYRTVLPGAAAVELGHNFSLVHDDIEDQGLERRHRPALWTVSGVAQAINTGDTLFTLSRMALYRLRDEGFEDARILRLMRLYDETCLALCEGQFMDIWASEHGEWLSVEGYFDMIGRKTAALIAGSAEAGAILATEDETVIDAYRGFGWALGLAFQLNDDLLGLWGDAAVTGKEASDIATRKKTLPLIYARQEAVSADAARLEAILAPGKGTVEPADAAEALAILERAGARQYTRRRAQAYRDEAMARVTALHLFESEALERLVQLAESAISA